MNVKSSPFQKELAVIISRLREAYEFENTWIESSTKETFEEHINSLSNMELLNQLSNSK